jgi:hypothetical protein
LKRFNLFFTAVLPQSSAFYLLWGLILSLVPGGICYSQGGTASMAFPNPAGQELQLAKAKSLYAVVDITKNIVFLKARGIPLRTFPLTHARWIGEPLVHSTVIHLNTKDPSVSPIPITPLPSFSSGSPPEDSTPPLTVNDMPKRYELAFQENLTILVQPYHLPSFWENMVQQVAAWGQRLGARMGTWNSSHQNLVISLDSAEAQTLYWSTIPPMTWLVIPGISTAQ